ncbi:MAG: hypothetical protein OSJ59_14740 [Lachnospiraceae bacterium]|nr:hypothetical protein [Lachnospiraceae bacterium]
MAGAKAKNELAVVENFDLQTISGDLAQTIAEEMDGLGALPFDRVKIPSGGGLAFELPGEDDENPESATEIVGVILDHHPVNAYWREKFAGGNEQPDCSSFDGKLGVDRETGEIKDCASCPYNQFGSDDKGKACKNVHRVFILREGNPVPLVLSLPPTSLKYMRDYIAKRVILKGFRCWQAVTKITLKKEKNAAGIAYSRAVFTFVGKLSPEKAKEAEAMKDCVKQQYRQLDVEGADYNATTGNTQDGPAAPKTDEAGFMNVPEGSDEDLPFN